MRIFKLTVYEKPGHIEAFFERERDAVNTFLTTYSRVKEKPRYEIKEVEVLRDSTHL